MSYQTGGGMLLMLEVTEAALADGDHRRLWEHLIPLLPQCDGWPRECDNIATHVYQSCSHHAPQYACEACVQNDDAGDGWEAVPWIAHVVAYRLLLQRQPKGRPQ